ncbi:phosphopantetheine-binding protein [Streptomyces sp. NPDC005355]|uniref:phosphopantetheine-binding protein n=1 Tax=Streptomyces sp. NPDC005355 TaxID=3157038 RepID=UPI0033AB4C6D
MTDETVSRTREHVAVAWAAILDGAVPAETDNFFQAGGTSLKALRLCARLSSSLDRKVPVKLLLKNSTFGAFVSALETADA